MSLTIAAGDLLTVRLGYDNADAVGVAFNVLHYQVASTVGAAPAMGVALSAVGSAMYTKWAALWAPAAGGDTKMAAVTVTDVFPLPRSVSNTFQPVTPTSGGGTGDSIPLQDAPTLLKTSDVGNRWGMGRLFYVGLAEGYQDSGYVEVAGETLLNTMAAGFDDPVSVSSGGWSCVLNPVLLNGPEDNPVRLTRITGGRVSNRIIKTRLSRRPGKGI